MLTFSNLFSSTNTTSLLIRNDKYGLRQQKKKKTRRKSKMSFSSSSSSSSTTLSNATTTTILPIITHLLPRELLLLIIDQNNFTVSDIIQLSMTNLYFYNLIHQHHILANQFLKKKVTLRLYFDQESRWRFAVDMKLVRHDASRFTFKPVDQNRGFRLFSSKVLRDPVLYKVTLHHEKKEDCIMVLFKKQTSLKIKSTIAYSQPLDALSDFCYSVHPTPADCTKLRPGERWLLPLLFECHPRWFMHHHHHHGYTSGKQLTHRVLEAFSSS